MSGTTSSSCSSHVTSPSRRRAFSHTKAIHPGAPSRIQAPTTTSNSASRLSPKRRSSFAGARRSSNNGCSLRRTTCNILHLQVFLGIIVSFRLLFMSITFRYYIHEEEGLPIVTRRMAKLPTRQPLVNTTVVQQRHDCIQQARRRHIETFGPIIQNVVKQNRKGNGVDSLDVPHWLVDPAYHDNVGDTMFTLAELTLFRNFGLNMEECLYTRPRAEVILPSCHDVLNSEEKLWNTRHADQLAFWHAGGNWGDLYRAQQAARLPSVEHLLRNNFTVVGMPQSLFYQSTRNRDRDVARFKASIARGLGQTHNLTSESKRRITLSSREQESYDEGRMLYPFVEHRVVPDIAFQLGPFEPIRIDPDLQVDVLFFLRQDSESIVSQIALRNTWKYDATYRIVEWKDRLELFFPDLLLNEIPSELHFDMVPAVRLLSLGTVAVVDRLHAAVLCYLTGIPFVFLDQVSGKLTKTLNVALDSLECRDGHRADWRRANNLTDAISKSHELLLKNSVPASTATATTTTT